MKTHQLIAHFFFCILHKNFVNACILWFTDFHLDPYYGTPNALTSLGGDCTKPNTEIIPGCDSSFTLITSSLYHANTTCPFPDFIVVTGDLVRHGKLTNTTGRMAQQIVADTLSEYFPDVKVLWCIGNNDVEPDYFLEITSIVPYPSDKSFQPDLVEIAENVRMKENLGNDADESFKHGGYYSIELNGILLIVLNTIIYHPYAKNSEADPFGQFEWLAGQASIARNRNLRIWILAHIPPGQDYFKSEHSNWQFSYLTQYLQMMDMIGDLIDLQLYGHTHNNMFYTFDTTMKTGPMLVNGAISPGFKNNPMYRLLEQESGALKSMQTYFFNLTTGSWGLLYEEGKMFGLTEYSNMEYRRFAEGLLKGSISWDQFQPVWGGGSYWLLTDKLKADLPCVMLFIIPEEFKKCMNQSRSDMIFF